MKMSKRAITRYKANRAIARIIANRESLLNSAHNANFHDVVKIDIPKWQLERYHAQATKDASYSASQLATIAIEKTQLESATKKGL